MIKKLITDSGNIVVFDYAIAYSNGYEICDDMTITVRASKNALNIKSTLPSNLNCLIF